jgi:hypothetical protein
VHASWNGATDVASWRVRPDRGEPKIAPRTGFETTIRLSGRARSVRVEALDASGALLGTSGRVRRRPARG